MKITWNLKYSYQAYVYSIVRIWQDDDTKYSVLEQTNSSYKSNAIYKFCFDKKVVSVTLAGLSVKCDKLDEEFLKFAKQIPATDWEVWGEVSNMLFRQGKSRQDVVDYLKTVILAKHLKP